MSDLPGYEPTPVESPKKPRRKPVKKRRKVKVAVPVVKHKKRRVLKAAPSAKEEVFLSDAVYKTIRTLVDLSPSERGLVFSIVKGLTK